MNDQQILTLYTQAYNQARQTGGGGQETSHQIAHIAGLQAIAAIGGGEAGTIQAAAPPPIPAEDPAFAHQRRLSFASHWLDEAGRRQRIAAQPTFTHVTDAFAAGGLYERVYLSEDRKVNELVGPMLKAEENVVHERLAMAEGMHALLSDLHDIVGVETPEELVATLQSWAAQIQGQAAPNAPTAVDEPFEVELDPGSYAWCACGFSQRQPFCDGSHEGTEDQPVPIKLKKKTKVKLCQCKQTGTPPYCDGSHTEATNTNEGEDEAETETETEAEAEAVEADVEQSA